MSNDIPTPPQECPCGQPTAVTLVRVQHKATGKVWKGPWRDFSIPNRNGGSELKSAFRFITWLPQCAGCFYANQEPQPGEPTACQS